MTFDQFSLRPELLRAVDDLGFTEATPIQEEAIPHLIGKAGDFVGLAQTGTGKTGAYALGLLQGLNPEVTRVQGIVVCPTRELCLQVTGDLRKFSAHLPGTRITSVYGGANIQDQIKQLRKGSTVVVATPGRLVDLMRRKAIDLSACGLAVLDEADEMLSMGFQEDLESILGALPDTRHIWLFSATMPKGVKSFAGKLLRSPREVTVGSGNQVAANITHRYYRVHEKHRYVALRRLLDLEPEFFGVVFCRTRRETADVAEKLVQDGYAAEPLHGDLSQAQRDAVMRRFRNHTVRVMVATDVAARGLDVADLTHVVHYRLPEDGAMYTHRSGRTARAGKSGMSLAILNTRQQRHLETIARDTGVTFEEGRIPDGREIGERQLMALVERVRASKVDPGQLDRFLPRVEEAFSEFSREELIQHFIAAEFERFLDTYAHAADINLSAPPVAVGPKKGKKGKRKADGPAPKSSGDMQTLFFGAGKLDGIRPGAIVRVLCDEGGLQKGDVGNIKIKREFSFVDIRNPAAPGLLKRVQTVKLDGRDVPVRAYRKK